MKRNLNIIKINVFKKYKVHKLFTFICIFFCVHCNSQIFYNKELLDSLNHIKNSNTIAKHFASIYYEAIEIANKFMLPKKNNEIAFVVKFESKNVPYFFQSFQNFKNQLPQTKVWQYYYSHPNLNEMQYKFIGMNAHINGDMWFALINAHPCDSIIKHKKKLLQFQKVFNIFFDSLYTTTLQYKKVKFLNFLTFGLGKYYGRKMVYQWRKNAVQMAVLWYRNPKKFKRFKKRMDNKMMRYNKFAIQYIK